MIYSIDEVITALKKAKAVGLDKVEIDFDQCWFFLKDEKQSVSLESFLDEALIEEIIQIIKEHRLRKHKNEE